MGSRATRGTAHFPSFGFDDIARHPTNIIDVAGRQVWSIRDNVESQCRAIARRRDPVSNIDQRRFIPLPHN